MDVLEEETEYQAVVAHCAITEAAGLHIEYESSHGTLRDGGGWPVACEAQEATEGEAI